MNRIVNDNVLLYGNVWDMCPKPVVNGPIHDIHIYSGVPPSLNRDILSMGSSFSNNGSRDMILSVELIIYQDGRRKPGDLVTW